MKGMKGMKITASDVAEMIKRNGLCEGATAEQMDRIMELVDAEAGFTVVAGAIWVTSDQDIRMKRIEYMLHGLERTRNLIAMGNYFADDDMKMRMWRDMNDIDGEGDIREQYEAIAASIDKYQFAVKLFRKMGGDWDALSECEGDAAC